MKFNLPNFSDLRGKLASRGSYKNYPLTNKKWLVIHHSATESGSAEAFARYHVGLGWYGIGYHIVIEKSGEVKFCHDLDKKTYHVGNYNSQSIGICLTGDFRKGKQKPTQEQIDSLYQVVKEVKRLVPSIEKIISHQEVPGYAWKNCPGDNWSYQEVIRGVGVSDSAKGIKKEGAVKSHKIEKGDTFYSLSKKYNIPLIELQELNPSIMEKSLQIGQIIILQKDEKAEVKPQPKSCSKECNCECEHCQKEAKPNPSPKEKYPLPDGVLKKNDRGEGVRQLQQALNLVNFKVGNVDGHFGTKTEDALRRFQSMYKELKNDGIYGKNTKEKLKEKLDKL